MLYDSHLLTFVYLCLPLFILQGEMIYEIAGVYPAPSFFTLQVKDRNGGAVIKVVRSLATDSLQLGNYQVTKDTNLSID